MTDREQIVIWELKLKKAEEQKELCPRCGNHLPANAQLSHKINQGSRNTRLYGKAVINHPLNMDLTCPGSCNSKTLIDNKPIEKKELLEKIRAALNKELLEKIRAALNEGLTL